MKEFKRIKADAIQVRDDRQRTDFGDIEELAQDILEKGLINPIAIDTSNVLIAGERRLRAYKFLSLQDICDGCGYTQPGWFAECPECDSQAKVDRSNYTDIPATVHTVLNEWHREAIELSENLKRKDLSEAEKSIAIARVHNLYQTLHGPAVRGRAGAGWGQKDTAKETGISTARVNQHLATARILELDPTVGEGATTQAEIWANFKTKRMELIRAEIVFRAQAAESEYMGLLVENMDNILFECDGVEKLRSMGPDSIDLILTDVPYGIDAFRGAGLRDSSLGAVFRDDKDTALKLIDNLIPAINFALRENSHAFIFCSWQQTFQIMRACLACKLDFEVPPLIWDKMSSIPSRQPTVTHGKRHEYCMHLRRGVPEGSQSLGDDVFTVRRVQNPRYPTEKPLELLESIIESASEPGSLVFDPCCGSAGTAIAALQCGRKVIACDISSEAIAIARYRFIAELGGESEDDEESDADAIPELFEEEETLG